MRFISIFILIINLWACKSSEVTPRNCRFATIKEEQTNLDGSSFTTVSSFTYDENNDLIKMDVNSSRASNSLTLTVKNDSKIRKIFEFVTSGGRVTRDTLKFDNSAYRKEHIYRSNNTFVKAIYEHDAKGFPTKVTVKDFKNVLLSEYEWLNDGKNLTSYQQITAFGTPLVETYEYYPNTINNRIYYISQFQIAKNFGRPPQEMLKKILRASGDVYEYTDYQYDSDMNLKSYVEKYTGTSFVNGHTRKVSFEYFCLD